MPRTSKLLNPYVLKATKQAVGPPDPLFLIDKLIIPAIMTFGSLLPTNYMYIYFNFSFESEWAEFLRITRGLCERTFSASEIQVDFQFFPFNLNKLRNLYQANYTWSVIETFWMNWHFQPANHTWIFPLEYDWANFLAGEL